MKGAPLALAAAALCALSHLSCAGGALTAEGAARRGRALTDAGRYERAERELRSAVAMAEQEPAPGLGRALAFYSLGDLYLQYPLLSGWSEAGDWLQRAADEYQAVLGASHPAVGLALARRAEWLRETGDAESAAALDERALGIFRASLPPDHPVRIAQAKGRQIPIHPEEIARVRPPPQVEVADRIEGGAGSDAKGELPAVAAPRAAAVWANGTAEPIAVDTDGTFLRPNVHFGDGSAGFIHVTSDDMPWIVSIGFPQRAAKYGSVAKTREVAIDAMRMWERAIQPHLPWFRLAFVEDDPDAHVQVVWKRRTAGPQAGTGGLRFWRNPDGSLRVGGSMHISTDPSGFGAMTIDRISILVAHEFGHVLGLGHCLECDSAMNYAWHTRDRVIVTETDVRTFLALVAQPNAGGERQS